MATLAPTVHTLALFAVWWASNTLFAIDTERFFSTHPSRLNAIDLAVAQTVLGLLLLSMAPRTDVSLTRLCARHSAAHCLVGSLHTAGAVLTAVSYSRIGAASTLMWKLAEPAAAITLKLLVLHAGTPVPSLAAVLVVLAGVVVFSAHDMPVVSYSPVISSNIVFPLRNALLKLGKLDEDVSPRQHYADLLLFGLPLAVCAFVVRVLLERPVPGMFVLLLRNALLFNLYQFSSITMLARLDTLSHSLLNTFKRFSGILISMVVLGRPVFPHQVLGIAIAFSGFLLYVASERGDSTIGRLLLRARRHSLVFPLLLFIAFSSVFLGATIMHCFSVVSEALEESLRLTPRHTEITSPNHPMVRSNNRSQERTDNNSQHTEGRARAFEHILMQPYEPVNFSISSYNDSGNVPDNVGNMVWRFGAHERVVRFPPERVHTCYRDSDCIQILKSHPRDSLVLHYPRANSLSSDTLHAPLEKIQMFAMQPAVHRIIVNGIGIQIDFKESGVSGSQRDTNYLVNSVKRLQLPKVMQKTLKEMNTLPIDIMTRGDYTEMLLQRGGLTSARSTVCPSQWINRDVRLGQTLELRYRSMYSRLQDRSLRVAVTVKSFNKYEWVLRTIAVKYPNALFYAQTEWDLRALRTQGVDYGRMRIFSNVADWIQSLSIMDVSFGGRIHGNMMAIAAGIPVLVVAVDYRLLEMVQRMHIPFVTLREMELLPDLDVAHLARDEGFDGLAFDRSRCGVAKIYRDIYSRVGLEVQEHVKSASETC